MRSLNTIYSKLLATGVVGFTGAAPQVSNGNKFLTRQAARGSLSAFVAYNIKTNTITFTAKWQVSTDGSAWTDIKPSNAAAEVIFATGNGGQVTTSIALNAPDGVYGYPWCRLVITTGVGVGAGAGQDDANISYSFVKSSNGS